MPIPDYQSIMLPLLRLLVDREEYSSREAVEYIARTFNLSEAERRRRLPSGQQPIIDNRVGWAKTYMKKAGLLESTRRGYFRITDRGLGVLEQNPSEINVKYLSRFPEFAEFRTRRKKPETVVQKTTAESLDPRELLENAHERIMSELADELLKQTNKSTSIFFENLVLELLLKMGYGGSRVDAGEAIGRIGDEGIDGIIKQDKLGLDSVYIQAKKWEAIIGRPEIHKFVGALKGQGANKGIFITTSGFSKEAKTYASKIDTPKIVLIDGTKLAQLMIEYDIGVSTVAGYEVKKIDLDYFTGD